MSTDMEKFAQDYYAAWNLRDWEKLSSLLTDDIICEDTAEGRVVHGKQEMKAYYADTIAWSADVKFEIKSLLSSGNRAVSEWVMSGTHTGDIPGLKATGKNFSVRGVTVVELRDGKICRETEYWNIAAFLQQIGLLGTSINWFGKLIMRLMMRR
jgi:steroid delta-isomerase-like uncharacterized protein